MILCQLTGARLSRLTDCANHLNVRMQRCYPVAPLVLPPRDTDIADDAADRSAWGPRRGCTRRGRSPTPSENGCTRGYGLAGSASLYAFSAQFGGGRRSTLHLAHDGDQGRRRGAEHPPRCGEARRQLALVAPLSTRLTSRPELHVRPLTPPQLDLNDWG